MLGDASVDDLISAAHDDNQFWTWVLRFCAFLSMWYVVVLSGQGQLFPYLQRSAYSSKGRETRP